MRYSQVNKKGESSASYNERKAQHEKHLRKQKEEAEYNNLTLGHHTNHEKNVFHKLVDQGTDFTARFPIILKYSHKDFNALKNSIESKA